MSDGATRGGTDNGGMIPQSEIDRANEDIVGVIRKYLPDLKRTGKNWTAKCPFHKEKSGSFTANEAKAMYYCFGCGAGGNAVGFVMNHLDVNFREAVESILGRITLEPRSGAQAAQKVRAVQCSLPNHAENPERAAEFIAQCQHVNQHPYLMRNNTTSRGDCLQLKGSLIVPLINNIGQQVNAAAITSSGITYAAGNPSYGSTAVIEPMAEHDSRTIICADYAHAWRLWWAQRGSARVLCAMEAGNLSWMLANCKDRFTHVGCDPLESEWYQDEGYQVVALPVDPYAWSGGRSSATDATVPAVDTESACA